MTKGTRKRSKSAEQERADRIASVQPVETLTNEELELIQIYRGTAPKLRAALLTLMRFVGAEMNAPRIAPVSDK
jgi:hypothetical protein